MTEKCEQYPVIGTNPQEYVPWEMLVPHEDRAIRNHAQTLKQLASRGGLGWGEILAILEDRPWRSIRRDEVKNKEAVMRYVSAYQKEGGNGNS